MLISHSLAYLAGFLFGFAAAAPTKTGPDTRTIPEVFPYGIENSCGWKRSEDFPKFLTPRNIVPPRDILSAREPKQDFSKFLSPRDDLSTRKPSEDFFESQPPRHILSTREPDEELGVFPLPKDDLSAGEVRFDASLSRDISSARELSDDDSIGLRGDTLSTREPKEEFHEFLPPRRILATRRRAIPPPKHVLAAREPCEHPDLPGLEGVCP